MKFHQIRYFNLFLSIIKFIIFDNRHKANVADKTKLNIIMNYIVLSCSSYSSKSSGNSFLSST